MDGPFGRKKGPRNRRHGEDAWSTCVPGGPGAWSSTLDWQVMTQTVLLLLMALASSLCFNLDTDRPTIFHVDRPGFGYSVAQYDTWVVVGAPQEVKAVDQTGGIYRCAYKGGTCEAFPLQVPTEAVNMSLGLSLAAATNPSQLLACGPTVHRACRENMHLNGLCFQLAASSQGAQRLPAVLQECPKQEKDIMFLTDGSGSISSSDFATMLNFVKAVMSQFHRPSTQFALMQFSDKFQLHFTFNEFKRSSAPQDLLDRVNQMTGWTHTATAIKKATQYMFRTQDGARNDATKILIVITDGQKQRDELDYADVIPEANKAGILRYAIGVGSAFQSANSRQELQLIASKPSQEHVFHVENFNALRDIQNQLKEKIFAIEGTQSTKASSFELELSQEGFSAVFSPDGPVLGAVGSFSWSGGAFLYPPKMSPTFINMSQEHVDMEDSYLGYAIESALWKGEQSLVLGAPRHQHTGKVVIFTQGPKRWLPQAEVTGTQIGSYFGATLCSVDVDRDGSTDLVLIGAPHYYKQTRGGQVSVCPLPQGRILGSQLSPSLQFFGQSLSGGQDLSQDWLADLAVGAQGHAVLLRSRPVLNVWVKMSFSPEEIARSLFECRDQAAPAQPLGDAEVCLTISPSSRNWLGNLQSSVTYDLALDPGRLSPRAIFEATQARNLTQVQVLGLGRHCSTVKLLLLACVEDSVTPITFRLNLSLEGKPIPSYGSLQPMLDLDAERYFVASLPFEKNCGTDRICQDDLRISFDFSGLKMLLVGSHLELNMHVTVGNDGEDSYGTTIVFSHPTGLSYRRVTVAQNPPPLPSPRLTCESRRAESRGPWKTSCNINHLIFRGGTQLTFVATFDVDPNAKLGDQLLLMANVSSENNTPRTSKTTFQKALPVKYAVYVVINSHAPSTKHLNFSASEEEESGAIQHRYQVSNLGQRKLPVSISFWVPVELNGVAVWKGIEVLPQQGPFFQCSGEKTEPPESDSLSRVQKQPVLDCSVATCLKFQCDIPSFDILNEFDFILKGNLSFGWVRQTLQKKVLVKSVAEIKLNGAMYSQLPGQEAFMRTQVETVLEKYEVYNPIPIIVGSSVGGLFLLALITATLYKIGFFKRQYKDMMEEAKEGATPEREASDSPFAQ
ncbi:integrin alpha-X [Echinops telfairi]|uniref:Integrin alpha-X n=1 Tax=Echinops telfairi TaxID=9371 RepID=A0AC55CRF7_ECHTE|nr:integrin alpha-X [Echinops telfairi]